MLAAVLAAAAAAGAPPRPPTVDVFRAPGVGVVHALVPRRATGLALIISGDGGWKPEEASGRTARALADRGVLALGIDVNQVFSAMGERGTAAFDLGGVLERLTAQARARYGVKGPVMLSGYSAGATLAYAAYAQSPRGRFQALLTEGFCPEQASPRPVGGGAGRSIAYRRIWVDGWIYRAAPTPGPWALIEGGRERPCAGGDVARFAAAAHARLWTVQGLSHGFGPQTALQPALDAALAWVMHV